MKNISRNKAEHCVRAKVMRRNKIYEAYFTLKRYRTWPRAEAAARGWLKELLPRLPAPLPREGRLTRRNHSGVVGVHRAPGLLKKRGKTFKYPRWIAEWKGCPFHGGIGWSVKQFGEEGAFVLAVLSRQLRTVDRDRILRYLEKILDTPKFDKICAALETPRVR